ncbi:MAG: SoxR reducing system RseC family protein [Bacteroidales bacterium]|nr:SoxR reducing system RseC family protein [Bacteroidales bacterium]MCF8328190.1 SoxR reducing system RseC family protein [Bacteroidales bacterium]
MENPQDIIRHPGKIVSIDRNEIHVQILSMSACSSCHAKGFCSAADMENKIVDVKNNYQDKFQVGDNVTLVLKRTKGSQAVFLGYIMPFLVVLTGLIVFTTTMDNEGLAGLFSLALLAPYYIILSRYRDKIKERFDFKIQE